MHDSYTFESRELIAMPLKSLQVKGLLIFELRNLLYLQTVLACLQLSTKWRNDVVKDELSGDRRLQCSQLAIKHGVHDDQRQHTVTSAGQKQCEPFTINVNHHLFTTTGTPRLLRTLVHASVIIELFWQSSENFVCESDTNNRIDCACILTQWREWSQTAEAGPRLISESHRLCIYLRTTTLHMHVSRQCSTDLFGRAS